MLTIENISNGLAGEFFTIKGTPYMVTGLICSEDTYLIQLMAVATTQRAPEIEVFLDRRNIGPNITGEPRYRIERITDVWKFVPWTIGISELRNKKQFIDRLEKYLNQC